MKKNLIVSSLLGLLLTPSLLAHARWIVPSHTILSSKEPEAISFDISVSNDIFHADRPLGGKPTVEPQKKPDGPARPRPELKLEALLPDGKVVSDLPITQAGRKSVASYVLDQNGTYRFSLVQAPSKMTFYKAADGKGGRVFGEHADAKTLPAGSSEIKHVLSSSRVETFVSRNGQAGPAAKPYATGLDFGITPHPNDLFVGETSEIQIYIDGKPAGKDIKIALTPNGTRYRNDRGVINLTTDDKGKVSHKWLTPGLYLVEIEHSTPGTGKNPVEQSFSLFVTIEVSAS